MNPLVVAIAAVLIAAPVVLVFFEAMGDIQFFGVFSLTGWNSFKALMGLVFFAAYACASNMRTSEQSPPKQSTENDEEEG